MLGVMDRRILFVNPNADRGCTAGIAAAIAPFGPGLHAVGLPDGPPAIASWRDWAAAVEPLCRFVAAHPAAGYVVACVSDPGVEALRALTPRPVLGMFRCAVAAALARAERFGVLGFVAASEARQRRVLQAMGVEGRLAAWEALDLPMPVLLDGLAARDRVAEAASRLAARGAEAVILGCAGLAHHAGAARAAAGVPVIEPCAAAAAQALLALHGEAAETFAA